jgi:hypothetical protein
MHDVKEWADLLLFLLTFVARKCLELLFLLVRVLFSLPGADHCEVRVWLEGGDGKGGG